VEYQSRFAGSHHKNTTLTKHNHREAAEGKAAADAQKKAEKAALLAAEEASQPSKPKGAGAKTAVKKTASATPSRGLDLSQLDAPSGPAASLNASGIDNALDALSLATGSGGAADKIDRHPERRFKAAYAAFEERRLEEMAGEKGLRRQQKVDQIRKEFEKSPENPFNQAQAGTYDMSKEEMKDMKAAEKARVEARLVGSS